MQRSQCLAPGPLGNALAWMCHVMLNGTFSSFNFQTCFDRVVPALPLDPMSSSCSPFLVLKPLEVDPIYFITFSSTDPGFEMTSALYTICDTFIFKWAQVGSLFGTVASFWIWVLLFSQDLFIVGTYMLSNVASCAVRHFDCGSIEYFSQFTSFFEVLGY